MLVLEGLGGVIGIEGWEVLGELLMWAGALEGQRAFEETYRRRGASSVA